MQQPFERRCGSHAPPIAIKAESTASSEMEMNHGRLTQAPGKVSFEPLSDTIKQQEVSHAHSPLPQRDEEVLKKRP